MGETIEYLVYRGLAALVRSLSLKGVRRFAAALGWFVYHIVPIRRSLALRQLRQAFPEKGEAEIAAIARESYRSFVTAMLELLWFPKFTREDLLRRVQFENPDLIRRTLRQGKGLILLSAHIGNWELLAYAWRVFFDMPVLGIIHTPHNRRVAELVDKLRMSAGNRLADMKSGLREVMRALRNRETVILLTDQSAPKEALFVPFLGRPAATYEGAAHFAFRSGAPVLMALAIRRPDGDYLVRAEEVSPGETGEATPEALRALTARHVAILEKYVRAYPGQWLWQHRRWKHTPPEAAVPAPHPQEA